MACCFCCRRGVYICMIEIDAGRCVGCGACAGDCFPGALTMDGRTPRFSAPASCIGCGHCIAVCPVGAVSDPELPEVRTRTQPPVQPEALLEAMQFRRSCRHYTEEPLTEGELQMLLTAGRWCPTAKNLQDTSYLLVRGEKTAELRRAALHSLGDLGRDMLRSGCPADMVRRAQNFVQWDENLQADPGFDPIFFHAPNLILILAGEEGARDAAAAAAYMEILAQTMGLGCLYSGYFCAVADSPAVQAILQLPAGRQVVRCLVLGHPDIRFRRIAPRKPADIRILE